MKTWAALGAETSGRQEQPAASTGLLDTTAAGEPAPEDAPHPKCTHERRTALWTVADFNPVRWRCQDCGAVWDAPTSPAGKGVGEPTIEQAYAIGKTALGLIGPMLGVHVQLGRKQGVSEYGRAIYRAVVAKSPTAPVSEELVSEIKAWAISDLATDPDERDMRALRERLSALSLLPGGDG